MLIFFISLRSINLSADPPDNLSPNSCGEYGDPGNYAFNARNKVLFGRWKIDDFNVMYVSPVPHLFTYASFLLFGPGIWQMNLVPLFFSILIFVTLFLLSKKYFPKAQILFIFLLTINYPLTLYSRIANRIMPMTFFVLLAIFFFLKAWEKPKYFFLTSLFLCFSFLSKAKILYFHLLVIPLSLILILIQRKELFQWKLNLKRLFYFFSGVILIFIPWYFFLYVPQKTLFVALSSINIEAMFPTSLTKALVNWLTRPSFSFYKSNSLLSPLLFLYFFSLFVSLFNKKNRERISPLEIVCSLWLVVGLGMNSLIGYRPIRHYMEFTIPILILTSLFLVKVLSQRKLQILLRNKKNFYFLTFLLIWIGVTSYSKKLCSTSEIAHPTAKLILTTILISFGILILIFLVLNFFFSRREITLRKKFAIVLVAFLVGLYSFQNIREYGFWVKNSTYNLKTISRDLGKAFPQAAFCGLLVPSISLENRSRAHTSWANFVNDRKDFLKEKKVSYLFLGTYNNESSYYEKYFPEEMRRAEFIARYRIWRSWFLLYEIKDEPSLEQEMRFHEAEKMERETGMPLFDPAASNRFSVFIDSEKRGMIGKGNLLFPAKDRIKVVLFIKIKEIRKEGPLLVITISKSQRVIYKKTIQVKINREDSFKEYQPLSFEIISSGEGNYELALYSLGNYAFYFDRMEWELFQ